MTLPQIIIKTERLILNALTMDDLPIVHAEWGAREIARMTASVTADWSVEQARNWMETRHEQRPDGFGLAIRRASDNRLIGSVGMGGAPRNIGYLLARPFWGQGYATEAVSAFLGKAYDMFADLDVIEAGVFDDNPSSSKVLTKLGFQRVGSGDCTSLARDSSSPNSLFRLTRAAYSNTSPQAQSTSNRLSLRSL